MYITTFSAILAAVLLCASLAFAPVQAAEALPATDNGTGSGADAFAQLGQELPTPNIYRTASGSPGHAYWQQEASYKIDARLDEEAHRIDARATISYRNNSPDTLRYLWLQLDQNRFMKDSLDQRSRSVSADRVSYSNLRQHQALSDTDHGYTGLRFRDSSGKDLPFTVVDTVVRVDLPTPLASGTNIDLDVQWEFNILERDAFRSRGGYERFPESNTQLFFLSQWFPRLAVYSDYDGWHNKAFLGRGEFTLEFGDYDVSLTVPDNHIVSATGELSNAANVLTPKQRQRLAAAGTDRPSFIVTPEEAFANEATTASGMRTWRFQAENVRDFAWASSSKFIWDAMVHEQPGARHDRVLAMSFYPNEAEPVWSRYSTQAVAHTMEVYSRFSFDYPYPTAQSVNTWKGGGMEYPMITFNGYRPDPPRPTDDPQAAESKADEQRAYSRRIKYGLIGVVIHEVGHIYFPMVVNSDERQWTWMDEGLNTFLEYVAELEWEEDFPAFRGSDNPLHTQTNVMDVIPAYMQSTNQVPVMTQSDSVLRLGPNAYTKPAAALTVLRETVMGRELFDFAFREYARRWKFKRPTPADFFRTMEDASGVDLDWFWRAWFYTTDYVDVAIHDIRAYRLKHDDPDVDYPLDREEDARDHPEPISLERNRAAGIVPRESRYEELQNLYSESDRFTVSNKDRNDASKEYDKLEPWEQQVFERAVAEDSLFYFIDFENLGGVPTPLLLDLYYEDGSQRALELPAEIWRRNSRQVTHRLIEEKPLAYISVDQRHQTADANYQNNRFPPAIHQSRLSVYKADVETRNLMADLLHELKESGKTDEPDAKSAPLEAVNDR
ncbi:MAG: hypothetical protein ACI87W_003095 [Halieaceae bacterium]|jgi:hypothetical protein